MRIVMLTFATIVFCAMVPSSAQAEDFGALVTTDLSAPGSVKRARNDMKTGPRGRVWKFSLPAGYCNPKRYEAGSDDSDCKYNSSRSTRVEKAQSKARQPKEAWYGWWVYFPRDFPYGRAQTRGHYEFAYWHNRFCPHLSFASFSGSDTALYLETNERVGGYDCRPTLKQKIVPFSELVGRWTRFEVHVVWSEGNDGFAEVYVNGELRTRHKGRTLTKNAGGANYFVHGIYLCCTQDVRSIRAASIVFGDVSRAATRSGLK